MTRTTQIAGVLAVATLSVVGYSLHAQAPSPPQGALTPQEAQQLAHDAYIYGYPLVTMEITRRHFTNVETPEETAAPMGQFANLKKYPTADFKGVTAPNADTLYSTAWLDVSHDAYVLELPDVGNRFYMMPMLDGWTNVFAVPGTRATGTAAGKFLITGPGWSGTVPQGMKQLMSPTAIVWILGRTYSSGTPADYAAVHALQAKYKLTPLAAFGPGKTTPPVPKADRMIDTKTPPRDQVNALTGTQFFTLLAQLMKTNPPSAADAPMVAKLARLGIVAGQDFDPSKLDPQVAAVIDRAPKDALAELPQAFAKAGENVNGWAVAKTGDYGTQYLFRASVAYVGLGANRPEDAIYPTARTDEDGKPLDASENNYVITFPSRDDLPPVKAFWSITMYDPTFFFVKNAMNRQNISSRNKLVMNPDHSIDIYVQSEAPPRAKLGNWLPAPKGPFVLMLRMYWPDDKPPSILDGTWKPPGIRAVPKAPAQAQR
jgi:hypothetical protein